MNKADWMTGVGGIVGVLGIGVGLWWADSAAALFISASILHDGVKNLRSAVAALMDSRATTVDGSRPHPLGGAIDETLRALDWVSDAASRVRDQGHVFHVEAFVVGRDGMPTQAQLQKAWDAVTGLDWKVEDLVVVPVDELPEELLPGVRGGG